MLPIAAVLLSTLALPVSAALTFNVDFGRDGDYDSSFSLGFDKTTWADIYISGVDSPGLISVGFELDYDYSALKILNAKAEGWDFYNFSSFTDSPLIVNAGMLVDTRIGDNILLASVQFQGIAATATSTDVKIVDGINNDFILSNGTPLDVEAPTIPQPGSMLLLASGLLGLLIAKNRLELRTKEQ
ncbi:hypothetical protein CKO12_04315 [Chromatium okenii]|nr:hypothetical protein [Chromatium okenii]